MNVRLQTKKIEPLPNPLWRRIRNLLEPQAAPRRKPNSRGRVILRAQNCLEWAILALSEGTPDKTSTTQLTAQKTQQMKMKNKWYLFDVATASGTHTNFLRLAHAEDPQNPSHKLGRL